MRDNLAGADATGETYLNHAKTTALKDLETLREGWQDYVNIMCFDGDGIEPLNAKSTEYNKSLPYQFFSDKLDIIVKSNGSTKDTSATDTSNAINAAILEMDVSIPGTYLKVYYFLILLLFLPWNKLLSTIA